MAIDLFGPDGSPRAVTTRPAEPASGPTDTWFADCVGGVAGTGTPFPARWANRLKAQLGRIVRACGIAENHADDDMVAKAIQSGKLVYASDTGTADALAVTLPVVPPGYVAGLSIRVKKASNPNETTAPTINVNGLGAKVIVKRSGSALAGGDLPANSALDLLYDGTSFRLLGQATSDVSTGVAATKAPFNIQRFLTTTRAAASAGAGVQAPVWSGISFAKRSATSKVVGWLEFPYSYSYSNPCSAYRLSNGTQMVDGVVSTPSAASSLSCTGVFSIDGCPVGTNTFELSLSNPGNSWSAIFNPTSSDSTHFAATPRATLILAEVEP